MIVTVSGVVSLFSQIRLPRGGQSDRQTDGDTERLTTDKPINGFTMHTTNTELLETDIWRDKPTERGRESETA